MERRFSMGIMRGDMESIARALDRWGMSMMSSRRVWRLMMKRRREEWLDTERGRGRGEREHWRLESWRMENTVPAQSLRGLITGGEGREGTRRRIEVIEKEEMELLSWMNMEQ